ncbi:hypothetical protein FRB99_000756 [Tulasnella sp. 403]|nr:hypothetical protein FRB99_000756 [Tulasnella sp. 403]
MAAKVSSPPTSQKPIDHDDDNPPTRPPPRPFKRANLSLEQNPFEVSFGQSQPSINPPSSPRATSKDSSRQESDASNNNNTNAKSTSPKPTLPPLSALAEGAQANANGFPWGFSVALNDAGSLRSGPLSPAMLPGPRPQDSSTNASTHQHHGYFDAPSLTFRTGLTPGIGRTGLTPLVGGPASFPPPSPNTAAFLAMVTNTTPSAAGQPAAATITPNTLSALTGSILPVDPSAQNPGSNNPSQAPSNQNPHPLSVSHVPPYNQHSNNFNQSSNSNPSNDQPFSDSYAGAAQSAAAAAANGLFLLSQAHQELAKREEQQQAEAAAAAAAVAMATRPARRSSTVAPSTTVSPTATTANGHGKRKSGDSTAPTSGANGRPAGKRAKNSTTAPAPSTSAPPTRSSTRRKKSDANQYTSGDIGSPEEEEDDVSIDGDDMQTDQPIPSGTAAASGGNKGGQSKKYETEEEKRRNFLERNRMAALKCRQRKKAWLNQLQQQVEYLKAENERLQGTIVSMRDEVTRLSAVVVAHRACGLGGVVVPGYAEHPHSIPPPHNHNHHQHHPDNSGNNNSRDRGKSMSGSVHSEGSPMSPVVGSHSVAPVSVPVNVPLSGNGSAPGGNSTGYGY